MMMKSYGKDSIKYIYQNTDYDKLGAVLYNEIKFFLFSYLNDNFIDRFSDI